MKNFFLLMMLFSLVFTNSLLSQRIISGKVISKDDEMPIFGASIVLKETKIGTLTDIDGLFSLKIPKEVTTIVVSSVGYTTQEITIGKDSIFQIRLTSNALLEEIVITEYKIKSKAAQLAGRVAGIFKKNDKGYIMPNNEPRGGEKYKQYEENDFKKSKKDPVSTFSIDVDKTAYTNMRRYIKAGLMPPKEAIRIEEMINYFDYHLPNPNNEHPIAIQSEIGTCPWETDHLLMKADLQAKRVEYDKMPPNNLVFLIDVSGSMQGEDRLGLLKKAFRILVNQLRENDYVSIVTYAGNAGLVLAPTQGNNKQVILKALDRLEAGGSTAGGAGIELAYQIATEYFNPEGNNRVILATDGDFNVGINSTQDLENFITKKRENDIYLSVLGFGTGNTNDEGMETLADKGNGNYFYIDTEQEAEKVFTKELTSTILTVANDVKLQLEFNPNWVESSRLVGYENRHLDNEDFKNDKKDAGELGAGNSVTVLYEIIPQKGNRRKNEDTLRYQSSKSLDAEKMKEWCFVQVRYKKPKHFKSILIHQAIAQTPLDLEETSDNFRFAAAVAACGQILRGSKYKGDFDIRDVLSLAQGAKGKDTEGYRQEFIDLMEMLRRFK